MKIELGFRWISQVFCVRMTWFAWVCWTFEVSLWRTRVHTASFFSFLYCSKGGSRMWWGEDEGEGAVRKRRRRRKSRSRSRRKGGEKERDSERVVKKDFFIHLQHKRRDVQRRRENEGNSYSLRDSEGNGGGVEDEDEDDEEDTGRRGKRRG